MNLKPVNTMERITRQQLADNFDEILDKVISDNIGYVILDNDGNDGQVLCRRRSRRSRAAVPHPAADQRLVQRGQPHSR